MESGQNQPPNTVEVGGNAVPGGAPATTEAGSQGRAASPSEDAVELDICADTCPMTFVRTRIALDRLAPGALLRVRLRGEEPRRSVPRTAQQQGHEVVSLEDQADGTATLLLRKGQRRR